MLTKLMAHPQWRQLVLISVALPALVGLAVVAFAGPAANIEPRDLPVGVIGATATTEAAVTGLEQEAPGAYDLKIYSDVGAARQAIEDRDIYGAFDVSGPSVTVYTSTAASSTVATLLSGVGQKIDGRLAASAGLQPSGVQTVDVVPSDPDDLKGVVLSSALLPLTICSIIIAAAIALVLEFGPAWRMIAALAAVSAVAGVGVYAVSEWWLGALPHHAWATWGALSLLILAMSSTTAGLIALLGSPGLGIGAAIMVFVGNPFSGSTSAPELLPDAVDHIGQWLPPGAGSNLLRSATYFDGSGAGPHVVILIAWIAFGMLAVVSGHHSFVGFAARRQIARDTAAAHAFAPPHEAGSVESVALAYQVDDARDGRSHDEAPAGAHSPGAKRRIMH